MTSRIIKTYPVNRSSNLSANENLMMYEEYESTFTLSGTAGRTDSLSYKVVRFGNSITIKMPPLPELVPVQTGTMEISAGQLPSRFLSVILTDKYYYISGLANGQRKWGACILDGDTGKFTFLHDITSDTVDWVKGAPTNDKTAWDGFTISYDLK